MPAEQVDYVIIGGGILGLTIATTLSDREPGATVILLEKESTIGAHASGRNSGVLHAGFYYTADSLKARLTVAGNKAMREYCRTKGLAINECGKLVVATTANEVDQLYELERRGIKNGSTVAIISADEASRIEPNVRTVQKALWSPLTATIDPKEVNAAIVSDLRIRGIDIRLSSPCLGVKDGSVLTPSGAIRSRMIVNCAGLYADRIAHQFGFGKHYTILPFKGLYVKYQGNSMKLGRNIYPVPNLMNPFLGVHFTVTSDGTIKIGPTATPAFWRENYKGLSNFKFGEACSVVGNEVKLLVTNAFGFRSLAFEEIKKYNRTYFIGQARKLVQQFDESGFTEFSTPGIRAQLLDTRTSTLVQDFVVEGDSSSVHILNAVSPAYTCAFPFAEYVYDKFIGTGQRNLSRQKIV